MLCLNFQVERRHWQARFGLTPLKLHRISCRIDEMEASTECVCVCMYETCSAVQSEPGFRLRSEELTLIIMPILAEGALKKGDDDE